MEHVRTNGPLAADPEGFRQTTGAGPDSATQGAKSRNHAWTSSVHRSPNAVQTSLGNEMVVLHLASGRYYSLNGDAAAVWEALSSQASLHQIASAWGIAADSAAARSLATFVIELQAEGLVEFGPEPSDAFLPASPLNFGGDPSLVGLAPLSELTHKSAKEKEKEKDSDKDDSKDFIDKTLKDTGDKPSKDFADKPNKDFNDKFNKDIFD